MTTPWSAPVREYTPLTLVSVRPAATLTEVYDVLVDRNVSAVPVLGSQGELLGILSSTDLLSEARIDLAAPREIMRITPPARTASELMRRDVVTVDEEAPVAEAAKKMVAHRIHQVVVTRAGAPVGMFSDRDALCAVLRSRVDVPLESVMTTSVETVEAGDTIRTGIERLANANVHGLVVVDGAWPIGVFTQTEALQARALPPLFLDSPIEGVMSYETICLDVGTPLYRVAGHAIQMRVRRILAVHQRELRGIVSGYDLVRAMTL